MNLLTAKEAKNKARPTPEKHFGLLSESEKEWISSWLKSVDRVAQNGKFEVEVKLKIDPHEKTEDDPIRHIRRVLNVMELLGYSIGWECKWPVFDLKINWEFDNKINI